MKTAEQWQAEQPPGNMVTVETIRNIQRDVLNDCAKLVIEHKLYGVDQSASGFAKAVDTIRP